MPHSKSFFAAAICLLSILVVPSSVYGDTFELNGTVELGGKNVKVTLFEATSNRPRVIGTSKTNRRGDFTIRSSVNETESIYFLTADVGWGTKLATILGPSLPTRATINELTTVAASYSMAQFYRRGFISGEPFGLRIAAAMNNNIVDPLTGDSSEVLLNTPNADETNSLRMTRSLSNLVRACAKNPMVRYYFFCLTAPSRGSFPKDTSEALANLARDPGRNAAWIYFLTKLRNKYRPALFRRPDAWTVTVKVNDSGDDNFLFGGPANVAFDSRGYAWIANNTVQGTPDSALNVMVLKPNGKPADGGPGLPTSPIFGGGILGVGWGITVDPFDKVWIGNFGWGDQDLNWPTESQPGNGSVSKLANDGSVESPSDGFFAGTWRVQGIKSDDRGNIWASSFENDKVVYFPNGNPNDAKDYYFYPSASPFGMAVGKDGSAWISNSGGLAGLTQSSVANVKIDRDGEIELQFALDIGNTLKVIDVDSKGNAWLASQGDNTIYAIRPNGKVIGGFTGGGIDGPWGLTVDGEDNIWVANFGPLTRGIFSTGGISKLAGVNGAARPPGKKLGDALTPTSGYTLHSAGSQVLLHDGTPLNGSDGPLSFVPLMRQTSLQIDQGGNIWSINNWKPDFVTDIAGFDRGEIQKVQSPADNANPGGDGIVIFVGLAPPPKK